MVPVKRYGMRLNDGGSTLVFFNEGVNSKILCFFLRMFLAKKCTIGHTYSFKPEFQIAGTRVHYKGTVYRWFL